MENPDIEILKNLKIKTPRLELRLPTDLEVEALAKVATTGIQEPSEPHFQDENLYKSPDEIKTWLKNFIEKHNKNWSKDNWQLPFGVFYEGHPIGLQTMYARDFPIARGFGCGYWIGLAYQGKGLGTETVQAVLTLGFDGLNAREAYLGAWSDNAASIRIMEKLGFIPNGEYWMARNGNAYKDKRMRLPRENWTKPNDITFEGIEHYLDMFALSK